MDLELANALADELDGNVEKDYSGRGMYGKATAAVTVEERVGLGRFAEAVLEIKMWHDDVDLSRISGIRVDDWGMGEVLY